MVAALSGTGGLKLIGIYYGASATERSFGTIHKEKGIFSNSAFLSRRNMT